MSLLKTIVFLNVMEIVTTYYNGSLHFHTPDSPGKNTTTNGDIASKRTLLVNVSPFYSLRRYRLIMHFLLNKINWKYWRKMLLHCKILIWPPCMNKWRI